MLRNEGEVSDDFSLLEMHGDCGDLYAVSDALRPYFERQAKEKVEAEAKQAQSQGLPTAGR